MTDKEFKRLGRAELIEIIYELQKNEQQLILGNQELNRQLADRRIKIENAGSIADASLALNDIFFVAQNAANQYLEEIRETRANIEEQKSNILLYAQNQADSLILKTMQECAEMLQKTEKDIQIQWDNFSKNVEEVLKGNTILNKSINFKVIAGASHNE